MLVKAGYPFYYIRIMKIKILATTEFGDSTFALPIELKNQEVSAEPIGDGYYEFNYDNFLWTATANQIDIVN